MKKTLLATTALVAGFAGLANAVDVEMYGQVNKVLMFVDDGANTDFSIADNEVSTSRFGVKGSQALDNGLTASVLLEGAMSDNNSSEITQNISTTDGAGAAAYQNQSTADLSSGSSTWQTRHARVGISSDYGALFIGRQSTATDSVTEQDLVGVGDLMYSAVGDIGGGYAIRTKTGATASNTNDFAFLQTNGTNLQTVGVTGAVTSIANLVTVGALANNMDGNGRSDAIRYDSPIFNGFQGRVSVAQGGDMDVAAYYAGKYDAFEVNAALGYVMFNDQDTVTANRVETQTSGSVSVKHDSGIAGTIAYGQQTLEDGEKSTNNEDPSFYYVKAGYAFDDLELAVDYGNYDNTVTSVVADHELSSMGLGAQYNLGNGVSVGGMYRTFEADVKNTAGTEIETEDMSVYAMSLRVKF